MYAVRGHGESPVSWSGLGTYEKDDLFSAITFLKEMKTPSGSDLVDGRVGLFGVDLGGYVSLAASAENPLVKAVAVDSVYPDVAQFINHRLRSIAGEGSPIARSLTESQWTKDLLTMTTQMYLLRREDAGSAVDSVSASAGRRFFFITGKDSSRQATMTRDLHNQTKGSKDLVEVEKTRQERLYTEESASYDALVSQFFREAFFGEMLKTARRKP